MEKGFIYSLICPIENNIKYIGQTSKGLKIRLESHIRKTKYKIKKNLKLSKKEFWIKKLIDFDRIEELKIEIIESCDINIINEREIYWISFFKQFVKITNLTDGGEGTRGFKLTNEHKEKISKNRKGKLCGKDHFNYGKKIGLEPWFRLTFISRNNNPNIGKECKIETRKKISKANSGINNGMYGKRFKMSEDQKNKISNALKNSDVLKISRNTTEYKDKISNHLSIPIILLDINFTIINEFKNCRECAEYFNFTVGNIKNAVRHKRMIGKSLNNKYWVFRKDSYLEDIEKIKNPDI